MTWPLLIAGVGNLFLGDDAFGCEVTRRVGVRFPLRGDDVELRDFGASVRALSYCLAARTARGCTGTAVIVDAAATGAAPGTVQLFDLSAPGMHRLASLSHHALGLGEALAMAVALGARLEHTYLLGCEPASFEPAISSSAIAQSVLTPPVEVAAVRCVELLGRLIEQPDGDLVALCLS